MTSSDTIASDIHQTNQQPPALPSQWAPEAPRLFEDVRAAASLAHSFAFDDPLDDDDRADRAMATSLRRIGRVALLATAVGARFEREGIPCDPAAWMHAPRALFGGRAAIVACQDRAHFTRAMLLHGLGLGLDARADDIDDLVDDAGIDTEALGGERPPPAPMAESNVPEMELFTAVLADVNEGGSVFAFHARVAESRDEFERGLLSRLGQSLFAKAVIREGYDAGDPIVSASVSDAVDDMLAQVATNPASPLARGLDIVIEQRFAD